MKLWRNVLVHADARDAAAQAVDKSLQIAEAFGGRVTLFDAIESAAGNLLFEYPTLRSDHLLDFAAALRAEQLSDNVAVLESQVPIDVLVHKGTPGRALIGCALSTDSDLIVKAVSADDLQQMTSAGKTALHLLRTTPVSTWFCAPASQAARSVVAAVNLSVTGELRRKLNERIVLAAARLASLEGAELHIVCVADAARDRLYESILRPAQYRRFLREDRAELRRRLDEMMQPFGAAAVPHLVEGDALSALTTTVRALGADLVVLGRDGADPLAGVLARDFPERFLCRASCSLLLVTPEPTLRPKARRRSDGTTRSRSVRSSLAAPPWAG